MAHLTDLCAHLRQGLQHVPVFYDETTSEKLMSLLLAARLSRLY